MSFDVSTNSQFIQRAQRERSEQIEKQKIQTPHEKNDFSNLPLAVCTVHAINAYDAFELAENALSIELGLHSLMESRWKIIFSSGYSDKPISNLLMAPHMTVHLPNGKLVNDIFWFNQWPNNLTEIYRDQEKNIKIQESVMSVRKRMRKLPWREMAELALARHYQAFSKKDLEASFLDGWRLLEAIGGHSREKSETLVKRAAWFFSDTEERVQFGLHLMHRRNLISHGRPVKADDNEGLAFQMKEFITPMLRALLTNPFNFKNIQEFWYFCDLPLAKEKRNRSQYLLDCSAKFRKENKA
jgi:hypothetical protein